MWGHYVSHHGFSVDNSSYSTNHVCVHGTWDTWEAMTVGRLGALAAVERAREGDHLIEGLAPFLLLRRVLGRVLQRREVVDERFEVDVGALRRGLLRVRGVHSSLGRLGPSEISNSPIVVHKGAGHIVLASTCKRGKGLV